MFNRVYIVAPRLHADHEVLVIAFDPARRRWFATANLNLAHDFADAEGGAFSLEMRTRLNEDRHWLEVDSPAGRYWQPVNTLR